jgi:endonuclease/exonuclease/phosphatase family metal-dependent hydrolase
MMVRWLRVATWVLVLLLAIGLAAWLVGRVVTDRWEWSQWLWWIPTPFALAAALMGVLVLLVRTLWLRGSLTAVVVGVAIALLLGAYFGLVEHRMLSRERQHAEGVLVMHWNWTHSVPHHVDRHVDQILALQPDIGFMTDWQRLRRNTKERARLEPKWHVEAVSSFTIISRWPVLRARPIVSNDTTQVALVEIDTSDAVGRTTTFLLVDMPSELDVGRMQHMRDVRAMMEASGVATADIALGDFNTPRGSASLRALFPDMHHAYQDAGHGYGATYHRAFPLFHIDHILLSESVRATDYFIVDSGFGRHRAQLARVIINGATSSPRAAP